jgi:hypothetical protein
MVALDSAPASVDLADPETGDAIRMHFRVCRPCLPDIRDGPDPECTDRLLYALRCARRRTEHPEEEGIDLP